MILEEVTKRRDVDLAAVCHGSDNCAGRPLLHRHLMKREPLEQRTNKLELKIWLLIGDFSLDLPTHLHCYLYLEVQRMHSHNAIKEMFSEYEESSFIFYLISSNVLL